ncbi:hypothetical protein DY000_02058609 [Brassica cretica]|uniref:DUF4283 domain-containing protein n=1 Tax=Brassica cretica TaxID=69181 RepID=A0ABQ7B0H7_BRACR|nr:hypothetical protein DY000_02058609 [Brassica cretica]
MYIRNTKSPVLGVRVLCCVRVSCRVKGYGTLEFPLLEVISWQEVGSNLRPSGTNARVLRSDRAWLELGRYIATEQDERSVATIRTKLYLGNIHCDVFLTEHDLLRKDLLVFCGDLDVNFVVTVFDPNIRKILQHKMSPYLQPENADRHVGIGVSRRMHSSHTASHVDVGDRVARSHWPATSINTQPSLQFQTSIPHQSHSKNAGREREREKVVDSEDRYSTKKTSSIQSTILYDCDAEALSISIHPRQLYYLMIKWRCCPRVISVPRVQISRSSEVRYSAGKSEELSRS